MVSPELFLVLDVLHYFGMAARKCEANFQCSQYTISVLRDVPKYQT